MSPAHMKGLVGPTAFSISGKHDDKYVKPNHDMRLRFKKIEKLYAKNQSGKTIRKTKSLNKWEIDLTKFKRKYFMKA